MSLFGRSVRQLALALALLAAVLAQGSDAKAQKLRGIVVSVGKVSVCVCVAFPDI